jgi:hypothetical protein
MRVETALKNDICTLISIREHFYTVKIDFRAFSDIFLERLDNVFETHQYHYVITPPPPSGFLDFTAHPRAMMDLGRAVKNRFP